MALRHFLLDGPSAWQPLHGEFRKDDETAAGYVSLLLGAFSVAVRRRFPPNCDAAEIMRFVTELRISHQDEPGLINPLVAEDVIRHTVDASPLDDDGSQDLTTVLGIKAHILLYLVAEAGFSDAELDRFIDDVVAYTGNWLAARRAEMITQP
ncbi:MULTISPECIES: hypothetical protein [Actinomadura]|nr:MULTISPECIES: hypothetical protein [Actinomadura]